MGSVTKAEKTMRNSSKRQEGGAGEAMTGKKREAKIAIQHVEVEEEAEEEEEEMREAW